MSTTCVQLFQDCVDPASSHVFTVHREVRDLVERNDRMKISSHPDHDASRVELVALVQHRYSLEARLYFDLRALGGHDLLTSAVGPSEVSVQFSVGSVAFHCAYSLQVGVQGVNNFCADFFQTWTAFTLSRASIVPPPQFSKTF